MRGVTTHWARRCVAPAGDVCASGTCFTLTTSCRDFTDCAVGEYCEPTLGSCLPQPGGMVCESVPTGGAVAPTLLWHWDGVGATLPTYHQVMMAPMVANLNDDNMDGVVDENDVPDVVFGTFAGGNYTSDGVLRAVSGADGSSVFDVTAAAHRISAGAQVAMGDIDGDGSHRNRGVCVARGQLASAPSFRKRRHVQVALR